MLRVCVVFGGVNSEHEVSLRSAVCILENLDKTKYDVVMLGITKGGQWLHYTGPVDLIADGHWEYSPYIQPAVFSLNRERPGLLLTHGDFPASVVLRRKIANSVVLSQKIASAEAPDMAGDTTVLPVDVVFPVLHGKNGEDGTIQGLLELCGIPYVGSGVLASAACMDKEVTHILLESAGVTKTKLIAVRDYEMDSFDPILQLLEQELGYPMFVKPANSGSSVGITKVKSREELLPAVNLAFEHDRKAVVEQAVIGREVECSVLGGDFPVASQAIGEISPTREYYDYVGKYQDNSTNLYIPARVDEETVRKVRETAVRAYRIMGCHGLARVDFFVRDNGDVVLNEINTMPGFTTISMYPQLFIHEGMTCSELINRLIDCAFGIEQT